MTTMTTTTGDTVSVDTGLDQLADELVGTLIRPDDAGYDEARALWNGLAKRAPAAIVRCAGIADVQAAVRFAAAHDLLVAVRGGGHNVAGTAGVDRGLVIDLSQMNQVEVDPDRRRVRAGGGATWADVDAATQVHGLAAPGGLVSQTGIGGLTLGGGIGWLRRKHGLACDNLVAATLVTADGAVHVVDEDVDPDVLWALRGGGGNFGVVTDFTYELHPVGPDVFVGFVVYPTDEIDTVLRRYRTWTQDLSEDVSSLVMVGSVPDTAEFPEDHWGDPCIMIVACAATDLDAGEALIAPVRSLGEPITDLSGPLPYLELQSLFDEDYPDGLRYYWKSLHLPDISDEVIALTTDWAGKRPSALSTIDLWHLGGAMAAVPAEDTAFGDRSAPFLLGIEANWEHGDDDDENIAWARACIDAFRDASTGREYLNFPGFLEDRDASVRAAHGEENHHRLAVLKRRLDPDNRFRLHQNIQPAEEGDQP